MAIEHIERAYRSALERAGFAHAVRREGQGLVFESQGHTLEILLAKPHWLCLSVLLVGRRGAVLTPNQFPLPPEGPEALLNLAERLNRNSGVSRICVHGSAMLVIVDLYLCGTVDGLDPATVGFPVIDTAGLVDALGIALTFMTQALDVIFDALQLNRPPSRLCPPTWRLRPRSGKSVVEAFLSACGARAAPFAISGVPDTYVVGWPDPALTILADFRRQAAGLMTFSIPLFEEEAREPGSPFALVDGPINRRTILACHEIAAKRRGMQCEADVDSGAVTVSLTALAPRDEDEAFTDLLPGLLLALAREAIQLPPVLGLGRSRPPARDRQDKEVGRQDAGVAWNEREPGPRWRRAVARRISRKVQEQRTAVLIGHSVPARGGALEVDAIVIGETGVWVLDCRSHSGTIEGNRNGVWHDQYGTWTHAIGDPDTHPLDALAARVFALKNALASSHMRQIAAGLFIRGVIVFPDNATLLLQNVSINRFHGNAPAVFGIGALTALLNDPGGRRFLRPDQVDALAGAVAGLA